MRQSLSTLVAMASLNFHRLMGKMKIGIYCYFIADILRSSFRTFCWVDHYQTYTFYPNLSIWLVVMATKRLNLWKIFKNQLWIKLNLCRNVHSISLYKNTVFLLSLHMHIGCYGNKSFQRLIIGKLKIGFKQVVWQNVFKIVCWVFPGH